MNPIEMPWRVVGRLDDKDNFATGCPDEAMAESLAKIMNTEAIRLGLRTRYRHIARPEPVAAAVTADTSVPEPAE